MNRKINFDDVRYDLRVAVSDALHEAGLPTITLFRAELGWPRVPGWQRFEWASLDHEFPANQGVPILKRGP